MGVPKFPNLGLPQFWGPIIFSSNLWLIWGLKQNYVPCQELSNDIWHATCMQGNRGDSRLLMVKSQTANLTPGPSFDYNLCFKCPNGSCEPISVIYIPRAVQWYKERLNPMRFDPCNHSLKIQESTETPTPKVRVPWECEGSFPHTLLHSREHEMWLPSFFLGPHFCKPLPWSWAQG